MPWLPFILMLLSGVIVCSSHLMENPLRSQYSETMTATMGRFNTAEHSKTRDSNLFRALSGYNEDTTTDRDSFSENRKNKKRNFSNSNKLMHNTIFSDIITLDAPPATMHLPASENENVGATELDAIAEAPFPASYFDEYYEDATSDDTHEVVEKRAGSPPIGCDCKINNDLLDLGQQHFPRYLLNAVCQTDATNEYPQKCRRGTHCKPLEYKVKVLTFRNMLDHTQKDPALAWLPDDLRQLWKFKTVTVAAGCFCSY